MGTVPTQGGYLRILHVAFQTRTRAENMQEVRNRSQGALVDLRSLTKRQLQETLAELGQPAFRTKQIEAWIWEKGASSFDEMTNLPKALRAALSEQFTLGGVIEVAKQVSEDGSRKYLLRYADGTTVECVGMPSGPKLAVCVSSQAGCAMKCTFCATGKAGLTRSLTEGEIYDQVMHVRDDFDMRVTSVVLMGQGEPFANYDASLAAMRRLNSPEGLGIGARHITVSTCGIIPQIKRFSNEPEQFTLAISLHSAVQTTRNALMPGVRKYSLQHLYEVMGEYVDRTGRRPTYEYALIRGVNDSEEELESLVAFCRDNLAHVNIIKLNEVKGSRFQPASDARAGEFVRRLGEVSVEATIRVSRGQDIDAACGQLKQRIGH